MIRAFASHPTAANLLMLLFLVLGVAALPGLKRETFPDFAPEEVQVSVVYPGASSEDVEEAVCQRLEDAVDKVSDVDEMRCEAREGLGTAVVRMRHGARFERFLDDVKTEVEGIDTFPEQVEDPVIQQLGRLDLVVSIALSGPMSERDLKAYAEQLKDRLQALDDVSQVTILGFSDHELRVRLSADVLRQFGLSMQDVSDAIARRSIRLPVGSIETRDEELLIRFSDERRTPRELEDLILIRGKNGAEIRLGDLAKVTDRFELREQKIIINGQRGCLLQITKTKSEDTLVVVGAVKKFLEGERKIAPPDVRFILTQDVSSIVQDRLELLVKNGLQGLVLVFLTLWLFFHLRFSFWVVMGSPVSFLGGLFFMGFLGQSINLITMVGLLIALGLLMDDAIVIAENIAARREDGLSGLEAVVVGTRQVAPGVISSFLTTVAIFGPLMFLEGDIGKVLKVLPVVLILVLAVSLVEAFWILPRHLSHAVEHGANAREGRFRRAFDDGLEWVRNRLLGGAIDWVIRRRYLFAGSVVGIFLLSVAMIAGGVLKFRAFPEIEGDVIEARLLLPQGTPLWRTEQVVKRLVQALHEVDDEFSPLQPQGERLVQNIVEGFNRNVDSYESGPHIATVTVDLLTAERRRGLVDDILGRWREKTGPLPDVLNIKFTELQIGPAGRAIDIRITGAHLLELDRAARELVDWLGGYRGVFDLSSDLRPGKKEILLRVRDGASALGVDAAMIAAQLRAAFYGSTASEIQVGKESYEVNVRLRKEDRNSLSDLEEFRITTPAGALVPLNVLAVVESSRGYARIHRIDGLRTVTLQGDVDTRVTNVSEMLADTRKSFLPKLAEKYANISISLEGQAKEAAKTGKSVARGFLLGLVGIFLLLSFQFRSYIEPVVVMVAIPFALIGVIWGHLIMGLELSMPSMMGFVSLTGIVVNDSILLVEFLKLRAREALPVVEAATLATRERFRAVLLTSLTTIAGLLPLLAERSLQAQILIPLVTSIAFGLLASTLLVLLVVPVIFTILHDLGLTGRLEAMADPMAE